MKIRTIDSAWRKINSILTRSFVEDVGCLEWGIIGIIKRVGKDTIIIQEVVEPDPTKDLDQSSGSLRFLSSYIRRVQLRGQQIDADGLVFFHTHPFARDTVSFSEYDNMEEPSLIENLQEVWGGSEYASIVAGRSSLIGRFYTATDKVVAIDSLSVIGRVIQNIPTKGRELVVPQASEIFDRAEKLTSNGALQVLQDMKIAIIGAGGIGSIMVELLSRAGCGNLILIDNDVVELSNLNRLLHSSTLDVKEKRKKVHVALSTHHRINMGGTLEVVDQDATVCSVVERLKSVDLLVGCVDRDTPRYVLNELAVKNMIPYLDLGSEIGIAQDKLQTLDARVTYVYPGGPCLKCRGLIDGERIRLEGLHPEERSRHIRMGYCQDIDIKQAAVMELNMRAASFASLFIRHLVQPFLDASGEMDFRESLTSLTFRKVGLKQKQVGCDICGYASS